MCILTLVELFIYLNTETRQDRLTNGQWSVIVTWSAMESLVDSVTFVYQNTDLIFDYCTEYS